MLREEPEMKVGLMAISDFPMAPENVKDLCQYVDRMVLRFDLLKGNREIFNRCLKACTKPTVITESKKKWNRNNWREELIRVSNGLKPTYLFFIDSDERYNSPRGEAFSKDFEEFKKSGKDYMFFGYDMVTDDGRFTPIHPPARHCKVIKWVPDLTYFPYKGNAIPTFPYEPKRFNAQSKILHFDFYTKEMQKKKLTAIETRLKRKLGPMVKSLSKEELNRGK